MTAVQDSTVLDTRLKHNNDSVNMQAVNTTKPNTNMGNSRNGSCEGIESWRSTVT